MFRFVLGCLFLLPLSSCNDQSVPTELASLFDIEQQEFIILVYTPYDCSVCADNARNFLYLYPNHYVYVLRYGDDESIGDVDFCKYVQNCERLITSDSKVYDSVVSLLPEPKFPVVWLSDHDSNHAKLLNTEEIANALSRE